MWRFLTVLFFFTIPLHLVAQELTPAEGAYLKYTICVSVLSEHYLGKESFTSREAVNRSIILCVDEENEYIDSVVAILPIADLEKLDKLSHNESKRTIALMERESLRAKLIPALELLQK